MTKLRLYLGLLFAAIFSMCLFGNWRIYRSQSSRFVLVKSLIDTLFVVLLGSCLPVLLIAYSSSYITDIVSIHTWKNRYWVITLMILIGSGLTMIAGIAYEVVLLISALPMNIITGKILIGIADQREKRRQMALL